MYLCMCVYVCTCTYVYKAECVTYTIHTNLQWLYNHDEHTQWIRFRGQSIHTEIQGRPPQNVGYRWIFSQTQALAPIICEKDAQQHYE